jgi:hypothetical protein
MSNPKAMSRNRLQRVEADILTAELDRVATEIPAFIAENRVSDVEQKKHPAYLPGRAQEIIPQLSRIARELFYGFLFEQIESSLK